MEQNNSKQVILSVLGVAILIVAVVGVSFAAFTFTGTGEVANTISTGTLSMTYSEGTNGISITNAMPITDEAGKVLSEDNEKFDFTVSAAITGTATINYEVVAVKDPASTLADADVRLYLEKGGESVFEPAKFTPSTDASALGAPAGTMVLDSGTFTASETNSYTLRMWVAQGTIIGSTPLTYTVKVDVYGSAE